MTVTQDAAGNASAIVRSLQARIVSSFESAIGAGVRDVALLDFPNHSNVGDSAIAR